MLFVGDDWAEDHHDLEVQDDQGRVMRAARLPEGVAGMARFHELVAKFLADDDGSGQVLVWIETDRGPWVRALIAAGYHGVRGEPETGRPASGGGVVVGCQERQDRRAHAGRHGPDPPPPVASWSPRDSDLAEAVKVVARAHQTLI